MVDVRTLAHEKKYSLSAVLADSCEVHHFSADWGNVELEVACVEYISLGSFYGYHARVGNGVVRSYKFALEHAEL